MSWRRHRQPKKRRPRLQHIAMPELVELIEEYDIKYILGLDEVATGALAGPIFVAGVLLPVNEVTGAKDSKRYTVAHKLQAAAETFCSYPHHIAVGSVADLATIGQGATLQKCYLEAIEYLSWQADDNYLVVVDGKLHIPRYAGMQMAIPKADARVSAVSTASVLAKNMQLLWAAHADREFPAYGFHKHHGYGTPEHRKCLQELGVTPWHRTNVSFVRELKEKK